MGRDYVFMEAEVSGRFLANVVKGDGCWEWMAFCDRQGYGHFSIGRYHLLAHRVAWYLADGAMPPEEMCVLHRCDNPSCVNPDHLFLGTRDDNNADRDRKGRHWAVNTPVETIQAARRLHRGGLGRKRIAKRLGISQDRVRSAIHGWRAIPYPVD